jgi:hypothetical protein
MINRKVVVVGTVALLQVAVEVHMSILMLQLQAVDTTTMLLVEVRLVGMMHLVVIMLLLLLVAMTLRLQVVLLVAVTMPTLDMLHREVARQGDIMIRMLNKVVHRAAAVTRATAHIRLSVSLCTC